MSDGMYKGYFERGVEGMRFSFAHLHTSYLDRKTVRLTRALQPFESADGQLSVRIFPQGAHIRAWHTDDVSETLTESNLDIVRDELSGMIMRIAATRTIYDDNGEIATASYDSQASENTLHLRTVVRILDTAIAVSNL